MDLASKERRARVIDLIRFVRAGGLGARVKKYQGRQEAMVEVDFGHRNFVSIPLDEELDRLLESL